MTPLDRVKLAKHEQVKRWILQTLRKIDTGSCLQGRLVTRVCAEVGAKNLSGQYKLDFTGKINKAVGALLSESPPKIERTKETKRIKLIKHRKKPSSVGAAVQDNCGISDPKKIAAVIKVAFESDSFEHFISELLEELGLVDSLLLQHVIADRIEHVNSPV